jgi:transposase
MTSVAHRRLIFIDESGAKTNMTRAHGRAPRGKRVVDSVPGGRWETTTMIAAVRCGGPQAPFVFPGPIDSQAFGVYVEQVLAPTLHPGDIVVLDNLSTHKDRYAREMILATGAELWNLPAYSPDLNPIEQMWSKIKASLRKSQARTYDMLVEAIGHALASVTPDDVEGWFQHCGYSLT